jgi:hypothetical protein
MEAKPFNLAGAAVFKKVPPISAFRLEVKGCNSRLPVPVTEELASMLIVSAVRVRSPFPEEIVLERT